MQVLVVGGVWLLYGNGEMIWFVCGVLFSDFVDKIDVNFVVLVQVLFNFGEMVMVIQLVGDEMLELLGSEMNYNVQVVSLEDEDCELLEFFDFSYGEDEGGEEDFQVCLLVVMVMGYVDYGKIWLLDIICKVNVCEVEVGGIIQYIGVYQVVVDLDGSQWLIIFIDILGYEVFIVMCVCGVKVIDIVILVVVVDDGVMLQMVEVINYVQVVDVLIVVVVNKIDKEGVDLVKICGQFIEYGLVLEEFGGDMMFVDILVKQGINIEVLEEVVLLIVDVVLDLWVNFDMEVQGVVIEVYLDCGCGLVVIVLVQCGILWVGDLVVVGDVYGCVCCMVDEYGEDVEVVLLLWFVQVIGFMLVFGVGDNFFVVDEDCIVC